MINLHTSLRCIIAGAMILAGCSQAPVISTPSSPDAPTAAVTPRPSHTVAPTLTATSLPPKSPTPPPSVTPQPWPTPAITPASAPITSENIGEVKQLAQFGMGTISDVALSADGTLLVVGSTTGIHFYDPDTLELIRVIPAKQPVDEVIFSHDGRRLMSMELWSHGLPIWDTATGDTLNRLDTWTGAQHLAAFSPDGQTIALANQYDAGPIQLWDITSGQMKGTIPGDEDGIQELAFSPNSELLASAGSYDGFVRLWNINSGKLLGSLSHQKWVTALAFTPNGNGLVTADGLPLSDKAGSVLQLWDVAKGTVHHTIVSATVAFTELQFSPNGSLLAGVDRNHVLRVWDASTYNLLWTQSDQEFVAGFSPDEQRLLTIGSNATLQWRHIKSGQLLKTARTDYKSDVYDVAFSPDGRLLASREGNNDVWLRSTQTGEVLNKLEVQAFGSLFEPNGQTLLVWGDVDSKGTFIHAYDPVTGQKVHELEIPDERVGVLAISPDGKYLALTADAPNAVQLRDAASGAVRQVFTATVSYMTGAAFSPDGRYLAAASAEPYEDMKQTDNSIWLWDLASGELLREFGAAGGYPFAGDVAFSPDGVLLAVASHGQQEVQIWDPTSGRLLHTLKGGGSTVAFSPDGRLLASGDLFVDGENTVHIWDTCAGRQLQVLKGHTMGAVNVAFSPDGRMLATGASDGTIRLWGIPVP